jgi:hypothetical protein
MSVATDPYGVASEPIARPIVAAYAAGPASTANASSTIARPPTWMATRHPRPFAARGKRGHHHARERPPRRQTGQRHGPRRECRTGKCERRVALGPRERRTLARRRGVAGGPALAARPPRRRPRAAPPRPAPEPACGRRTLSVRCQAVRSPPGSLGCPAGRRSRRRRRRRRPREQRRQRDRPAPREHQQQGHHQHHRPIERNGGRQRTHQRVARHDPPLTVAQYLAPREIARERVSASELARRTGVSGPAVSQLVAALEDAVAGGAPHCRRRPPSPDAYALRGGGADVPSRRGGAARTARRTTRAAPATGG